jgi:hypothetical protein
MAITTPIGRRMRRMSKRWEFEVFENGMAVAWGDAPDRDTALREASHYVMMYGQDGGEVKAIVQEEGNRPQSVPGENGYEPK